VDTAAAMTMSLSSVEDLIILAELERLTFSKLEGLVIWEENWYLRTRSSDKDRSIIVI
jgi:hypothetical protein